MSDPVTGAIRTISRAVGEEKAPNAKWTFEKVEHKSFDKSRNEKPKKESLSATYKKGDSELWVHGTRKKGASGVFKPVVEYTTHIKGELVVITEGGSDHVNLDGADGKISAMNNNTCAGDHIHIKGVDVWCIGTNDSCKLTAGSDRYKSQNPYEGLEFRIKADGMFEYIGPDATAKQGKEAAALINGALTSYRSAVKASVK